ncbi:MAG: ComF family protein [Pirellulales bacterium]|nr:ComF family protein [Pirellulales bacterium]
MRSQDKDFLDRSAALVASRPASGDHRWRSGVLRWCRGTRIAFLNLVVPPGCAFCDRDLDPIDGEPLLCETCRESFFSSTWLSCRRCGRLVDEAPQASPPLGGRNYLPAPGCFRCRKARYHFDAVTPLGVYLGELRKAVLRMKHRTGDHLSRALADYWASRQGADWKSVEADVVVPVPMHWTRRLARGTNSPEIMAARISRFLGVPVERAMLVRQRNTQPQADLSPTRRIENVRGAFRLGRGYDIKGARVLLIDDIMTTGATCNEAAKVLKQCGAAVVVAAVAARTMSADG